MTYRQALAVAEENTHRLSDVQAERWLEAAEEWNDFEDWLAFDMEREMDGDFL